MRDDRVRRVRRVLRAVALVLTLALAGAACGGGDGGQDPALTVVDGFTVPGARSIAAYLTIRNDGGPDALLGAALTGPDAGRAEAISMHRTVLEDGLALMRPADRIELRAGAETALEPGRAHLMIERLREPVELGETLLLVLELERSEPIEVEITAVSSDEALARLRGEAP